MVLKDVEQPSVDHSPSKERLPLYFQIAIDGPMGSGKTTVSEMVAKELGILFISTGQLYRSLTLLAVRSATFLNASNESEVNLVKLDEVLSDEEFLLTLWATHEIVLKPATQTDGNEKACVYIDGEDVTELLGDNFISLHAPQAASPKRVRAQVAKKQQEYITQGSVIMEGRDITHAILPQAQLKIYLDADKDVRAHRRFLELQAKGENVDEDQVKIDLKKRDDKDSEHNLKITPGVWVIDTTDMSVEEVVKLICDRACAMAGKLL